MWSTTTPGYEWIRGERHAFRMSAVRFPSHTRLHYTCPWSDADGIYCEQVGLPSTPGQDGGTRLCVSQPSEYATLRLPTYSAMFLPDPLFSGVVSGRF